LIFFNEIYIEERQVKFKIINFCSHKYMQGFQYTNNTLDFFPQTSTALSAGSEGYVKVLAAGLGGTRWLPTI